MMAVDINSIPKNKKKKKKKKKYILLIIRKLFIKYNIIVISIK